MAVCAAFGAFAVNPGSWEGELPVAKLPVRLNIGADSVVTLDSPKQGAKGIACEVGYISDDSVSLTIPAIGVELRGCFDEANNLRAQFTQGAFSAPLTMAPVTGGPRRPQQPVPPFPYEVSDFEFNNGDVKLGGTIDHSPGSEIAVVFITGSGPQNRDEEVMDHKPFAVIADHLARNGVSSLRYDDRGVGESTGDYASATIDEFTQDARMALKALRATGRYKKIGVIGHSEGGRIAWSLADEADFLIGLCAPAMSGDSILLDQNRALLQGMGAASVAGEYVSALDDVLHGRPVPVAAPMRDNLLAVKKQLDESPWLRRFIEDDPTDAIRAVDVPALAIYGGNDLQVDASRNAASLRAKNPKVQVMEMAGLNHMLQQSESGLPAEYYDIETTVEPNVLSVISMWIRFVAKR